MCDLLVMDGGRSVHSPNVTQITKQHTSQPLQYDSISDCVHKEKSSSHVDWQTCSTDDEWWCNEGSEHKACKLQYQRMKWHHLWKIHSVTNLFSFKQLLVESRLIILQVRSYLYSYTNSVLHCEFSVARVKRCMAVFKRNRKTRRDF